MQAVRNSKTKSAKSGELDKAGLFDPRGAVHYNSMQKPAPKRNQL